MAINQGKKHDQETQSMLYEGATISQLSSIFGMDNRNVTRKIYGKVQPVKQRGGVNVYDIKEAAAYLVKPALTPEEYVKHMHYSDLPPTLRKEFWAGMRSKQLYEIEAGDLWHTSRVQEHLIDIFKLINLSMRQVADLVEREVTLTDKQRAIIIRLSDELLSNVEQRIRTAIDAMPDRTKEESHDETTYENDDNEL